MGRLVILVVTIVALGFPTADLFAKSGSSGSHRSPAASGTGSKGSNATAKNYAKNQVFKGNYNPNTGKRVTKTLAR